MRYDRIDTDLIPYLTPHLDAQGFFVSIGAYRVQSGRIRTNCMDCLDRTNVVQASIARHMFLRQMAALDMPVTPAIANQVQIAWADHGDGVAMLYAGSAALKSDFTRTGRRAYLGALHDGFKALKRYAINQWVHGDVQDGLDLLHGKKLPYERRDDGIAFVMRALLIDNAIGAVVAAGLNYGDMPSAAITVLVLTPIVTLIRTRHRAVHEPRTKED